MIKLFASLVCFSSFIFPQTYLGDYTSHQVSGNSIKIYADTASLNFVFYKADIVKVEFLPSLSTVFDSSLVVIQDTTEIVSYTVSNLSDELIIETSELKIVCNKNPLRISYYNSSNKLLLGEPIEGGISSSQNQRQVNFNLDPGEHFYGTGERGINLDRKGWSFESYNRQIGGYSNPLPTMNINIPFLASSNGYALYFENTYPGFYDLGDSNPGKFLYRVSGGELSYFVFASATIPMQIEKYTWLTGRQPLPPRWALGYIQSKYGYRNESEARSMVQTMRQKEIPCDAIILDLYWFEHMGDISWYFPNWSDPFQMMSDFLDVGIKTIVITEPYLIEFSSNFQPAISNNYVASHSNGDPYIISNWWSCGCDAVLLDITNPAARQWWWSKHPTFFGNELAGIWTDLGEPENHPGGMNHHLGSRDKVHNIYNLLWAETIFNGINQVRPNQRIFNLTRSGYAGIQRYGVIPWSGDVAKEFGGLEVQLPMLLNMGISGLGYHNSDIGGFCCGNTTPELYVRWMQYGTFCPITRTHGVDTQQPTEPWEFGQEAEAISKKYIELRYRLLPYIYTMAYECYETGMPLARPLFFDNPGIQNLHDYSDAYLWGSSFLVAPAVEEGQTMKDVFLPGGEWIDFHNDVVFEGGQTHSVETPLDKMPLFVKRGSIIPMQPVTNFTDEQPPDTIILAVYPSENAGGDFSLYEDDGITLDYQSGSFSITGFSQFMSGGEELNILIGASVGSYNGKLAERIYLSDVHHIGVKPSQVLKNDMPVRERSSYEELRNNYDGFFYDENRIRLYVQVRVNTDSSYHISASEVVITNLQEEISLPGEFMLEQNYPNPFNSSTIIKFSLTPSLSLRERVTLKVYDVLGNEVATLVDKELPAGTYEVEFSSHSGSARNLASGIYFYQLNVRPSTSLLAGRQGSGRQFVETKKMILLK